MTSNDPAISANGARVVFRSLATNLRKDTNGASDIYLRERTTGKTSRVSLNWKGNELNGGTGPHPAISANGRWVAFESSSTNVTEGSSHSGLYEHVYARNLLTGKVKLVSRRAGSGNEESDDPELSAKGTHVAFRTIATNLIAGGDANGDTDDICDAGPSTSVCDRMAGAA